VPVKKPKVSGTVQKLRKEINELKVKVYRIEKELEVTRQDKDLLQVKHQLSLTGGFALRDHAEKLLVWHMAESRREEKKNANNPQKTSD